MFEDSLIESGGKLKTRAGPDDGVLLLRADRDHRLYGSAAAAVYRGAAQSAGGHVAGSASASSASSTSRAVIRVKQVQTDIVNGQLRTPTKIPKKVEMIKEEEAPPPMSAGVVGGVPGGVPGGSMGGVMGGIIGNAAPIPKVSVQRIRVSSGVTQGLVMHRVEPVYPADRKDRAHSGHGDSGGGNWQGWKHSKPARGQRASAADRGGDGRSEAVEVPALHSQRRARGSGHAG